MSDSVGGIKPLGPSYPVTRVQPSKKEREAGKRRQKKEEPSTESHEDDDQQPHIDELV